MEIQGSINQLLTLATVAAKVSPQVEKLGKKRELAARSRALAAQKEALPSATYEEIVTGSTAAGMAHKNLLEAEAKVNKEKFELSPSKETAKEMIFSESVSTGKPVTTIKMPASPEEIAMERDEIAREEAAKALRVEQARLRAGNEVVRPSGIILTPPSIGTRREQ